MTYFLGSSLEKPKPTLPVYREEPTTAELRAEALRAALPYVRRRKLQRRQRSIQSAVARALQLERRDVLREKANELHIAALWFAGDLFARLQTGFVEHCDSKVTHDCICEFCRVVHP